MIFGIDARHYNVTFPLCCKLKLWSLLTFLNPCLYSPLDFKKYTVSKPVWINIISHAKHRNYFLCPPSKKWGYIVLLMSVCLSVGPSVCPSVDHMVSANYLEKYLSQSLHISHSDWSSLVNDPYWFWGH
jgi:hypothetical protein